VEHLLICPFLANTRDLPFHSQTLAFVRSTACSFSVFGAFSKVVLKSLVEAGVDPDPFSLDVIKFWDLLFSRRLALVSALPDFDLWPPRVF
jgi:hypothetical protein